ncbi:MAG: hypothetical protein ACTSQY_03860, partial [Candidatus Odinarchaeia archaeon]
MVKHGPWLFYLVLFVVAVYLMMVVDVPYISVFWDWSVWVMLVVFLCFDFLQMVLLAPDVGRRVVWLKEDVVI